MTEELAAIQTSINELSVKLATIETLQRAGLAEQQRCNKFVDRDICELQQKHETITARMFEMQTRIERRSAYVAGFVAGAVLVMEWVFTWAWKVVIKFL
jgi:uncharacterized membrane protein